MIGPTQFHGLFGAVEGMLFTGKNLAEMQRWMLSSAVESAANPDPFSGFSIATPTGEMLVGVGDWLLKGQHGEFFVRSGDELNGQSGLLSPDATEKLLAEVFDDVPIGGTDG